ncbi:hypothetical protein A9Q84_02015 [Halobacteriovorax marinus]|uniref:FecR protein domain-containing protein n=1 Tax=Halobacteriovorax marinus TaxID=97084 RepID=A0A1Y5FGD6_9BACT|nr:hypothetical protein A9Q84_02015 [Halobacteriovorax marinus]
MTRLYLPILTILFCLDTWGSSHQIGKVTLLRGKARIIRDAGEVKLSKGSSIQENDLIKTAPQSLVRVIFSDKTKVLIGPNSEFQIEDYSVEKRVNVFKLVTGQFRAKIEKKVRKGESLDFKTKLAGLGVRGTEFLTNSYIVQGKSVTDTALLKGSLATSIEGANSFQLKAGQAFNTNALSMGKGLTKLSPEVVEKLLASADSLLPNMQNLDGTFNKINDLINKSLSNLSSPSLTPAIVGASLGMATVSQKIIPKLKKKKKKKRNKQKIDLAKEPWDIRDALMRKKALRVTNDCFYWFYKTIPGGGEAERFRRERDCDEFDNDL